jgi:hypothetical protein
MTLAEAIKWLQKIAAKHGGDVPIYFDCPKCEAAFTPTHLSAVAVHVGTTASGDDEGEQPAMRETP